MQTDADEAPPDLLAEVVELVTAATREAPLPTSEIVSVVDAGEGRGVFSSVLRVTFADGTTAIAKLPGPNREVAVATGAFERERRAYLDLLPHTDGIRAPRCLAVHEAADGAIGFLLEDLGALRRADQATGLSPADAARAAASLAPLHLRWTTPPDAARLDGVRRHAPATFPQAGLEAGLERARADWGDTIDLIPLERRLAERPAWLDRFTRAEATLCHGDARADNLVFDGEIAVYFDWQQIAVQTPAADLAWLLATSCRPDDMADTAEAALSAYASVTGRTTDDLRAELALGAVHPSSAVLLLAGREQPDEATRAFVGRSLERIAAFVGLVDGSGW